MTAKAFQFNGPCDSCGRGGDHDAAVALLEEDDDVGKWMCTSCAKKVAKALQRAAADAERRRSAGQEYRHDKWGKAARKSASTTANAP